jgi:GTP-binding protein EngB required for normal cell division
MILRQKIFRPRTSLVDFVLSQVRSLSEGRISLSHTDRFIGSKSQSTPKTNPSGDDPRAKNIWDKARRFRVLIIGRANAGKTTILQKVCNTVEKPQIFDCNGKKIKTSLVTPTVLRGMHDIKNELVFRSNPGFVFHDSRGFEAGGVAELNTVKDFVAERSEMRSLSDQLHVIW